MNKLAISEQIRTLRKSKGLSQEALAENAGINLRTLQRIETGNAIPRGETLRLLARALEVPVEALSELIEDPQLSEEEDRGFLKLMNLSALSFWVIPLGNILVPLAFWIYKKNKITGVRELGKRILNFQITWSLVTYGIIFILIFSGLTGNFFFHPFAMLPIMLLLCVANTIFIINTNRKITQGEEDVYSRSLKIIQ